MNFGDITINSLLIAGSVLVSVVEVWNVFNKLLKPTRETRELAQKTHDMAVRQEDQILKLDATVREEFDLIKRQEPINTKIVEILVIFAKNIELSEEDRKAFATACTQLEMYAGVSK